MVAIFIFCFTNSLNIALFILLLFLLEPFLKRYFSAACLYRLWIVLLIGLLIPMRFDNAKALFYISSPQISAVNNASDDIGIQDSNEFYNTVKKDTLSQKQFTLGTRNSNHSSKEILTHFLKFILSAEIVDIVLLSQLWILGAIFVLIVKGIQYNKYRKRINRFMVPISQEDLKEDYNLCIQELHFNDRKERSQYCKIIFYQCPIITSPMTIGIFKPIILFPEESYANKDFYFILKHELIHIRRRDSLMKLVRLIVIALNWYNPFCYVLSRHLEHWCEVSCDELVISNSTRSDCINYSKLLLKYTAVKKVKTNTINMIGGKDNMKYRLHSIMDDQRKKHSGKVLVVLLLCIVFTTVIVSTITHTDVRASIDNTAMEEPLMQSEEMGDAIADNASTSPTDVSDPADNGTNEKDMEVMNSDSEAAPTAASLGETVVEYAIQAEGAPYLWGGNDISIGVDSSGFTQAIYKKVGYDIPRTSREQASTCEEVSMDSLQKGDLIFYASSENDEVNHVGIYIGEDMIIHAKNARDGVTIQDIDYRKPLSAGRIITD
ncbi:MAG: peptidase BlaR1 [Herbinix sp.]|jgi:beta-lactamase regulating signal transducer with metallopeptidase domain/cell wall-associated NlpC family hydrolase|nr:peptidase BlaR1 [Herbinix sp.]